MAGARRVSGGLRAAALRRLALLAAAEREAVQGSVSQSHPLGHETVRPPEVSPVSTWSHRREASETTAAPCPVAVPPAEAPEWLASIARSIRAALADGAQRAADAEGWLLLIRPDGRRTAVRPETVAELAAAGLLPVLPDAAGEAAADDPDALAERAAIQGEPPLPPEGSAERAAADKRQADELAGLLTAALSRPPGAWPDVRSVPPPGAWCSCCGRVRRRGGRWWREAVAPTG
jgi:hypothetical protein